jgi:hypothetical protein
MSFAVASKNVAATAIAAANGFVSLHDGPPGTTGANEITGIVRQPVVWGAAAAGQVAAVQTPTPITIAVPPNKTPLYYSHWSLVTAGVFGGAFPLGGFAGIPFYVAAATDLFTADNHGLAAGDPVVLEKTGALTIGTGDAEETVYYVIASGLTSDTFKLSATSGGSTIDVTVDGTGFVKKMVIQPFGAAGGSVVLNPLIIDANR